MAAFSDVISRGRRKIATTAPRRQIRLGFFAEGLTITLSAMAKPPNEIKIRKKFEDFHWLRDGGKFENLTNEPIMIQEC